MDRSEQAGLGVAVLAHAGLLALLSLTVLSRQTPPKIVTTPVTISFAPDVALEASAPKPATPPAPSEALDQGAPEDAAPPAPLTAAPEPNPAPAPPKPQPKPQPTPEPTRDPKPEPAPKPKPQPAKAAPAPKPTKRQPLAPPSVSAADDTPRHAAGKPAKAAGAGSDAASAKPRPRGARLGADFLKGLADTPSKAKADAPAASGKVDARALAGLQDAIRRQIEPCADAQHSAVPPEGRTITIRFAIQLARDGSLAAAPRVIDKLNVNDDNSRYAQQVADIGIAAFKGCSPLHLPPDLYSTPAGGWNSFIYRWTLK